MSGPCTWCNVTWCPQIDGCGRLRCWPKDNRWTLLECVHNILSCNFRESRVLYRIQHFISTDWFDNYARVTSIRRDLGQSGQKIPDTWKKLLVSIFARLFFSHIIPFAMSLKVCTSAALVCRLCGLFFLCREAHSFWTCRSSLPKKSPRQLTKTSCLQLADSRSTSLWN